VIESLLVGRWLKPAPRWGPTKRNSPLFVG